MRADRGRLTVPDLLYYLMALAFVGALFPVVREFMNLNTDWMSAGTLRLWQMALPLLILVLMSSIYRKATSGAR